jgi:hypothetical protein
MSLMDIIVSQIPNLNNCTNILFGELYPTIRSGFGAGILEDYVFGVIAP